MGLLFLSPTLLSAKSYKGKFAISPKAGRAVPLGEFGKWHDGGFHAQSDFEYFVSRDFSVGAGVAFSQHVENEGDNSNVRVGESGDTLFQLGGAKTEIFPFSLTVKYRAPFPGRIKPFLQAGPVFYVTKDVIPNTGFGRELTTVRLVSKHGGYTAGFGFSVEITPYLSVLMTAAYDRILGLDFPIEYVAFDGGLAFVL